jgi:hypothetical protein
MVIVMVTLGCMLPYNGGIPLWDGPDATGPNPLRQSHGDPTRSGGLL